MTETGTTTIAQGGKAVSCLVDEIKASNLDWNEAETRFQIIDRIIVDCLGWPRDLLRLENGHEGRSYADYVLGNPRCVIWEAKRKNRTFNLPADPQRNLVRDLPSMMALNSEASCAITQAQKYCSERGVELAVATNGRQFIAFLATRNDGIAPLAGRCFVIDGYDQLKDEFPTIWQMLSPAGVAERRLTHLLNVGEDRALPPKLSSLLTNYPRHRYPSQLQTTLRSLGELLLIDVVEQEGTEREFFRRCYCESGALSQHALVSKRMLASRYASLFESDPEPPYIQPVQSGRGKSEFTPELTVAAISHRPVVLIGDVGVGKTSFLKHLMYVSAFEEFQKAMYIYVDFGSHGALSEDLINFVLTEIENQLYIRYDVDIRESGFVRGVYHSEISRFDRGIYAGLRELDPLKYQQKFLEFLEEKTKHRDNHLKRSISHIARGRKKQLVFVLDNVDQREHEVQEKAFIIAQSLAKEWDAAVFIAIRPRTFHQSKQAGSLTAYPHRVFTISPPRVDRVIEQRLKFALDMAEGQIPIEHLQDVTLQSKNVAIFLRALIYSLSENEELVEFLSNITAGNIRAVVEFVTKFIGNGNRGSTSRCSSNRAKFALDIIDSPKTLRSS